MNKPTLGECGETTTSYPQALRTFSVVILGYRNEKTICAAVASVIQQLEPGVDIVVVTSGPESGADAVRSRYPSVALVEVQERLMPGGARNRGIDVSNGDIVGFLAADCVAHPGWVAGHRLAHERGFAGVSAAIVNEGPQTPWRIASWLLAYSNRLPGYTSEVVSPSSARRHGLSVERNKLQAVGGYDPDIRIGEDTKMADELLAAGYDIFFDGRIRIGHRGPSGTRKLLTDEFRRGRLIRAHRSQQGIGMGTFSTFEVWRTMLRHSLAAGWRFSEVPRIIVVVSSPWLAIACLSQLLGARMKNVQTEQVGISKCQLQNKNPL